MSVVAVLAYLLVAAGGSTPAAPVVATEGGSREWLQAQPDLAITLYRSWQPPNVTVIDGMFRVEPELGQAGGECRYAVDLQVEDSAGAVLLRDDWESDCARAADGSAVASLETFQFAVLPARYTLRVSVRAVGDAARAAQTTRTVEGLAPPVRLSDLVLGKQVGWADSASSTPWTFRRGAIGILTASEVVVQAEDPRLAYYVEVYADSATSLNGRLIGVVKRQDGSEVVRVALRELRDLRQSEPVAGQMSVAGLPPGDYLLEARLELADTVLVRSHPFSMTTPMLAGGAPTGGGYFASLSDAELAELFDPLVVWLQTEAERQRYESLTPEGRRTFLREYFQGAEPSGNPESDAPLDVYLARVKHVQTAFRERVGRSEQEGWRTDRGRIYLRLGEPTSRVVRPRPQQGPPYEIWFYAIRSGYVYLFVDERGFGNHYLLYSNDPAENPLPGWEKRVGAGAIDDLAQLGIRVRASQSM